MIVSRLEFTPFGIEQFPTEIEARAGLAGLMTLTGKKLVDDIHSNISRAMDVRETGDGSFYGSVGFEISGQTLTVGNAHPGALAQEYGADIYPVSAVALHWIGQDGQNHFAKHVHLPARPTFEPALQGLEEFLAAAASSMLEGAR